MSPSSPRTGLLAMEVRIVAFSPYHCPETVISSLMHTVMAGLANDDAVGQRSQAADLYGSDMVGLRAFAKSVFRPPCVAKARNARAAAGTPRFLTSKG